MQASYHQGKPIIKKMGLFCSWPIGPELGDPTAFLCRESWRLFLGCMHLI